MSPQNYKNTITVTAPKVSIFEALTKNVAQWWTEPDSPMVNVGDKAKFTFPPGKSYWTFQLVKADPKGHIIWECVDALHIHEGQPKEIEQEWLGTKVEWHVLQSNNQAAVTIEHHGLAPNLLCYDVCQDGWDFFFAKSLAVYLETGQGTPHALT